jgi:hypothetical protein
MDAYYCYKCGKRTLRVPLCNTCNTCDLDNDYDKLKRENELMLECLSFIVNQKDKTGNWAVESAKNVLGELKNESYRNA